MIRRSWSGAGAALLAVAALATAGCASVSQQGTSTPDALTAATSEFGPVADVVHAGDAFVVIGATDAGSHPLPIGPYDGRLVVTFTGASLSFGEQLCEGESTASVAADGTLSAWMLETRPDDIIGPICLPVVSPTAAWAREQMLAGVTLASFDGSLVATTTDGSRIQFDSQTVACTSGDCDGSLRYPGPLPTAPGTLTHGGYKFAPPARERLGRTPLTAGLEVHGSLAMLRVSCYDWVIQLDQSYPSHAESATLPSTIRNPTAECTGTRRERRDLVWTLTDPAAEWSMLDGDLVVELRDTEALFTGVPR